jgi:hypothetical protein
VRHATNKNGRLFKRRNTALKQRVACKPSFMMIWEISLERSRREKRRR